MKQRTQTLPLAILLVVATLIITFSLSQTVRAGQGTPCVDGMAGEYACENVDILAHLDLVALGGNADTGVFANDNWGWTSPDTGKLYALVGMRDRATFVEVTDPYNPVVIGYLMSHEAGLSDYRDIKVYENHAFIVGDIPYTAHGMQVFDLTRLDSAPRGNGAVTFTADGHYDGVGFGHNMWINEETGFAYIFRSDKCESGTVMVDISTPTTPVTAGSGDGCLVVDGADSDAECVVYTGPDSDYTGREICFIGSDLTAGIADVTDKDNPVTIANFDYPNTRRAHQGALTADMSHWLISDTMDEMMGAEANTNTVIIDITDLDNPQYVRREYYSTVASDHNIYVKGDLAVMTNWRSGFRVASMATFDDWQELGFLDTHPESDNPGAKSGAWSHYDAFDDFYVVTDVERGLFLVDLTRDTVAISLSDFGSETAIGIWLPVLLFAIAAVGTVGWRSRVSAE